MATRKAKGIIVNGVDLTELFSTLVELAPTEEEPVTVDEMNAEMGGENTFEALSVLADAELVDFDRAGKLWLTVPDVSLDNAESILREALETSSFEPSVVPTKAAEYAERTKYNADVAASQEDGGQHLHPMPDARPRMVEAREAGKIMDEIVEKLVDEAYSAQTPVIAENGEKITIPVDFDDPSKGRRELDASKGERLLGETSYTVSDMRREDMALGTAIREALSTMPAIATWTPTFHESKITEEFEVPEVLPAVPDGVTENTWFMAHAADTETGRAWWMRKAEAQMNAFNLSQPEVAPF